MQLLFGTKWNLRRYGVRLLLNQNWSFNDPSIEGGRFLGVGITTTTTGKLEIIHIIIHRHGSSCCTFICNSSCLVQCLSVVGWSVLGLRASLPLIIERLACGSMLNSIPFNRRIAWRWSHKDYNRRTTTYLLVATSPFTGVVVSLVVVSHGRVHVHTCNSRSRMRSAALLSDRRRSFSYSLSQPQD